VLHQAFTLTQEFGHISHLCRKCVDGREVFLLETRMLIENFILGHSMGQPAQNLIDRNPHPANARLAVPLIGFDRDAWMCGRHKSIMARSSAGFAPSEWMKFPHQLQACAFNSYDEAVWPV